MAPKIRADIRRESVKRELSRLMNSAIEVVKTLLRAMLSLLCSKPSLPYGDLFGRG